MNKISNFLNKKINLISKKKESFLKKFFGLSFIYLAISFFIISFATILFYDSRNDNFATTRDESIHMNTKVLETRSFLLFLYPASFVLAYLKAKNK